MSNYSAEATGGCGAGLQVKIEIIREGTYDIVVGGGGASIYGASTHTGGDGGFSKLSYNNENILFCGGGTGGTTSLVKATPGTGGHAIMSGDHTRFIIREYTAANGNNGTKAGKGGVAKSPAAPIPGHTWGQSGKASAYYSGGSVQPGYHGYMKIVYKGKAS